MSVVVGATLRIVMLAVLGGTGCSLDGLLNREELPPSVSDPAITLTPEGARAAYAGTLAQFRMVFGGFGANTTASFVLTTALLTDELNERAASLPPNNRDMPEGTSSQTNTTYEDLQKTRGQAGQAIGLLTTYLPDQPALAGHLYALQGYAEVFLAELFCSGIPLSTVDFGGDFTYRPGSSTTQVLTHAVALFDTALTLVAAGDSARFVDLARIGRARALLALGQYTSAATAVAAVPDGYRYNVHYNNVTTGAGAAQSFIRLDVDGAWTHTVPDREGINGLAYHSDPRASATRRTVGSTGEVFYYPGLSATDGSSPIVLASGVEARLIEAEAALQANPGDGQWRTILNALRTDSTFEEITPGDTLWHAGSGGVDSLPPLADPGTPEGRVDLLFRERGFWLFLTGHRQGDLRRLLRPPYGRTQDAIYPVGVHPPSGTIYGDHVTAPIPITEFVNPLYTGCASRGA